MKKMTYLFIVIVFACLQSFAQAPDFPVDPQSKKIAYKGEVTVNSAVKKPALFTRAKNWGMTRKYTITALKKDQAVFAASSEIKVQYPAATKGLNDNGLVKFTVTITCKDGKYNYVITDFVHEGLKGRGNGGPLEEHKPKCGIYTLPYASWVKIKEQTAAEVEKFIEDMKAGMNGNIAAK